MNSLKIIMVVLMSIVLLICVVIFAIGERQQQNQPLPAPETDKESAEYPAPQVQEDPAVSLPEDVPVSLSNNPISWGIGPARNDRNQPVDSIEAQNKYGDVGGYFIFPDDSKTIYLTFDMGYENGNTTIILDKLKECGVKATFFITMDYVNDAPDLIRRIIDDGHTLANHTAKHRNIPALSNDEIRKEVMDLHDYIADHFHYQMTLFRPPEGVFSQYTINYLDDLGYKTILWSFAYVDWNVNSQPSPASAMDKTTKALHGGAIYLLHTCSSTNAEIIDEFIDYARKQGYHFGLIDRRIGTVSTVPSLI